MEKAKKIRPARQDSGRITGKRTKTKEVVEDGVKTDDQDDAEVEEFYEILRRIKVVVKYFEKAGESKPETAAAGSRLWSPRFELEDFKQVDKDEELDGVADKNVVVGNLDLNADPEADQDSD